MTSFLQRDILLKREYGPHSSIEKRIGNHLDFFDIPKDNLSKEYVSMIIYRYEEGVLGFVHDMIYYQYKTSRWSLKEIVDHIIFLIKMFELDSELVIQSIRSIYKKSGMAAVMITSITTELKFVK